MDRHPRNDAVVSDQSWWGQLCGLCYWPLKDSRSGRLWGPERGQRHGSEAVW